MTDLVGSETEDTGAGEPQLDTTNGTRDPLTTDDGLVAASAQIPQFADGSQVDDTGGEPVAAPGLDITEDGTDPLVDAAEED